MDELLNFLETLLGREPTIGDVLLWTRQRPPTTVDDFRMIFVVVRNLKNDRE